MTTMHELVTPFMAMASPCEIHVMGPHSPADMRARVAQAVDEVRRIERTWSRYRPESIVSQINAAAGTDQAMAVDDETAQLLDFAAQLHTLSDGAFDITSGVLRRAWDFERGVLPAPRDIDALLPLVGWQHVEWDQARADAGPRQVRHIRLTRPGMQLDFGGFGKEYAADRAAALLMAAGIAHGHVNLGGDIRVLGPRPDGTPWLMGIQHPRQTQGVIASVAVSSGGLATSGDYERFMLVDGRRYAHVLDARTGWPVAHWQSVSVQSPLCIAAGALATIALLKQADGLRFLQEQSVAFLMIAPDGSVVTHESAPHTTM